MFFNAPANVPHNMWYQMMFIIILMYISATNNCEYPIDRYKYNTIFTHFLNVTYHQDNVFNQSQHNNALPWIKHYININIDIIKSYINAFTIKLSFVYYNTKAIFGGDFCHYFVKHATFHIINFTLLNSMNNLKIAL